VNNLTTKFFLLAVFLASYPLFMEAQQLKVNASDLVEPLEIQALWECYGSTLSLEKVDTADPVLVDFPSLWEGQVVGHDTLNPFGYVTYRLQIFFDAERPDVSLLLEDMYSSYALYANRKLIAKNGKVATTRSEYEPEWRPQVIRLPESDTVELILQIANFDHRKGGMNQAIYIGSNDAMDYFELEQLSISLMLTGSLILGGLFFIGLYWFGRNDPAMLFFSLFCLLYTYRIIGSDFYVLHRIIPDIPWVLGMRLEYISLFLSAGVFANFVQALYPEESNKVVVLSLSFLCVALSLFAVVTPPLYFSQTISPFFILLIGLMIYGLSVFVRAYIAKRPGAQYGMISMIIVFFVFFVKVADYFEWLEAPAIFFFFGYLAFFFSQSLILSYRFSLVLKQSRDDAYQASHVRSEFLSTISHELRTPLNAIGGLTHLLTENKPRRDQLPHLKSIQLSFNNLHALVNDILDFSKIEKGNFELDDITFDLMDIFDQAAQTYEPLANAKGLAFTMQIDRKLASLTVKGDHTRINQVMNNLASNAVKFTEEGAIQLRAELISQADEHVTMQVEFEDTGVGIAQEKLEIIFQEFTQISSTTTRQFGGAGLGLSIVSKILKAMKSKVTVASAKGEGSRFGFILTLDKVGTRLNPRQSQTDSDLLSGKKVLVVEDNIMNVMIAEQFLLSMDIEVTICEDGQAAVDLCQKEEFDVILMDIHMPIKDGYDATTEILLRHPNQMIIALTASVSAEDMSKLDKRGFSDAIIKPFKKSELQEKLIRALSSRM
jgi:signal transduction histidine kinase/BarA-like signal transduction histidine kinase